MSRTLALASLLLSLLFLSPIALTDEEGLSRTSWGRFGWWETSILAHNRTNIDGLLSYNVTLDGLAGVIRTRTGEQWAGGPPYMTEPLLGNSRLWQIRIAGVGAGRSTIVLARTWNFSTDPDDTGLANGWEKPAFDDSPWRAMIVGPLDDALYEAAGAFEKEKGSGWGAQKPSSGGGKTGAWENQGLKYDGVAWYRLQAVIPAEWKGEKIFFHCFGVDDEDTTFVNGTKIGETTMKANPSAYIAERTYEIPPDVILWGRKNTFAVRVFDDHGDGGFTGSAPEIVRGRATLEAQSIKPSKAGDAPSYIKKANWVTKWIELPDYKMTYSLASALVRVYPKGAGAVLRFDAPIANAAYVGPAGVKTVSASDGVLYDPARDGRLTENWILLWHGDALGHNEDLPVLLVLHANPGRIASASGEVAIATTGPSFEVGPPFGLRLFSGDDTAKWLAGGLPDDVLAACRFWSRAALAYPVGHKELYSVDHDRDMVVFTENYEYEIAKDDWGTPPMKIAPVPPIVACLLDADYPGKMLSPRTDPGFISYAGPFAATVDSDTSSFELPIPLEDSFAGLSTPGQEDNLDELTRGVANLMQRWSGLDWSMMGGHEERRETPPPGKGEPMDFDAARERALTGSYPVIGIPPDHVPGTPIPTPWKSSPLNHSIHMPSILVADERVRPGLIAAVKRMARSMDSVWSDETFESGVWRVEVDPTFRKPMTYLALYRYENLPDRANGEAPYDFTSISGHVAYGFREAGLWTGDWAFVRKRWHKLLQACDSYWRNHDWATAACDNKDSRPNSSVDITWDNYSGLEALARCAYAIGDAKTYDFLCYLRSRLALGAVVHEALQQYLQPVLLWPDRYFAGHLGEPYPPYRSGLLPEGGVAMEWTPPYPEGATNQVPWRFNNAGVTNPGVGLRWMALTQPRQTRWNLDRMKKYIPHYMEGNLWSGYAPKAVPPFYNSVHRTVAANCITLRYLLGEPADTVLDDWNRLALAPALTPFNIERMTIIDARGQLQNLLFTQSSPLWASAWEPRVIWSGAFDPASGVATIIVEPGDAPLRFKGGSLLKPLSVSVNGADLPECATLKEARARRSAGWFYSADRQTLYCLSDETGRIDLSVRFRPDPDAPQPKPRMLSEPPVMDLETNLLANASFDDQLQNIARSPFVGAPTGPYLYVNRWTLPGIDWDCGLYTRGLVAQVGVPYRSAGLALRLAAGKDVSVYQNVPAAPGPHRLTAYVQLAKTPWDPAKCRFDVAVKALSATKGASRELAVESAVLSPDTLSAGRWTPITLALSAPDGTNAVQVALSFVPLAGDDDKDIAFPVYVDDVELVRVAKLPQAQEAGVLKTLAGNAPGADIIPSQRNTSRFLGDHQNDYWPDDPARPADPQLARAAQAFTLAEKSEVWMVDFWLGSSYGAKIKGKITMRVETSADSPRGPVPSGSLAYDGALATLDPFPWSRKYMTFTFDRHEPLPPGKYWLVLSKDPEDPKEQLHYQIDAGPLNLYPGGGYAEWETEHSDNSRSSVWASSPWNAFFKVIG
ncbi:MAG: hypothetical protein V2A58_03645, partial [Planctomycetota bacterium]